MLLLLTDGQAQSQRNQLQYSATALKNKFVNIMSIGVGYKIRRSELELIASRPIHQHVFQVRDAGALTRIVNTVKTEACKREFLLRKQLLSSKVLRTTLIFYRFSYTKLNMPWNTESASDLLYNLKFHPST